MTRFCHCRAWILLALVVLAWSTKVQSQTAPIVMAPAWQPVGQTNQVAYRAGEPAAAAATKPDGWPYYVAPATPVLSTTPMTAGASFPAALNSRMIVPDSMIRGMVANPSGQLTPAPITSPPIQNPATNQVITPVQPIANPMTTAPPAVASVPVNPQPTPAAPPAQTSSLPQPFNDPNVFVPGGQSWLDYDISSYTSRFPPEKSPEKSVREWILRSIGQGSWYGGEVASLVVTPDRVRVYHTPAVQRQVQDILGRFLHYMPGEFDAQVYILNVRNQNWRTQYGASLRPAGQDGSNGRLWTVSEEQAAEMVAALRQKSSGQALTALEPFIVNNGQRTTIGWSPVKGRNPDPQGTGRPTEEGIIVDFSPLIESDAATTQIDLRAMVRRDVFAKRGMFGSREELPQPEVSQNEVADLVRVAPGEVIVANLGPVSSFGEAKDFLGRERTADILVFILCRPGRNNTMNGRPVLLADTAPRSIERQIAARPFSGSGDTSRSTRPASRAGVPSVLTRPVY